MISNLILFSHLVGKILEKVSKKRMNVVLRVRLKKMNKANKQMQPFKKVQI